MYGLFEFLTNGKWKVTGRQTYLWGQR